MKTCTQKSWFTNHKKCALRNHGLQTIQVCTDKSWFINHKKRALTNHGLQTIKKVHTQIMVYKP